MDYRGALVAAGYQVEEDAAVLNLSPQVEVRANGLAHLLERCASHNLNPLTVLGSIVEDIKTQPSVKEALESPPTTKCHINVTLKNIRFEGQS
ncbi:MAG TPA: hypothetical protein VK797_09820 [Tepidisphaeraceae bacterium]|nr:hypothetical protein [Tepidisphaeraceae bacterium]